MATYFSHVSFIVAAIPLRMGINGRKVMDTVLSLIWLFTAVGFLIIVCTAVGWVWRKLQ